VSTDQSNLSRNESGTRARRDDRRDDRSRGNRRSDRPYTKNNRRNGDRPYGRRNGNGRNRDRGPRRTIDPARQAAIEAFDPTGSVFTALGVPERVVKILGVDGITEPTPVQEAVIPDAIAGRDVLIVEDIVDSGLTLNYLVRSLRARGPASVEVLALLSKPDQMRMDTTIRYHGFAVPNVFVVGYGLDYLERYRNLPYIGTLKSHVHVGR
jgi:hypothetical protein